MVGKTAVLTLLVAGLAACSRTPAPQELAELASVAAAVLRANPRTGPVPASQWPAPLGRLKPEMVYVTPEGLYVVTSSFFVEEEGLFVPRSAGFAVHPGTDPSYTPLGPGVFSYRIKG
jgi:hypothetical protein